MCVKLLPAALGHRAEDYEIVRILAFSTDKKEKRLFSDFQTKGKVFFPFITCMRVSGVCVDVYT